MKERINFLFVYHVQFSVYMWNIIQCEVPGNVHISGTEGIGNSWAREESQRVQNVKKMYDAELKLSEGGSGGVRKHPFSGGGIDNIQNYIQ